MKRNSTTLTKEEEKLIKKIIYEYKLTTKPSQNPIVHFLVAPPGAGKTGMELYIKNLLKDSGEDAVQVGSDKLATYHPNYQEWLQLPAEECYQISRKFTVPASEIIYEQLRTEKMNMVFEKTFHKGESDLEFVRKFKEAGYKIVIDIMSTDKYESLLSCYERDIKAAEIGISPRPIARENFDKMYTSFLSEVISMENMGLCDSINVFTRGIKMSKPNLVYKSGDLTYMNAYQAVEEERRKQRRRLLEENNSLNFQKRISEAIKNTNTFIDNEQIRLQSLNGLYHLQNEFLQELSREIRFV